MRIWDRFSRLITILGTASAIKFDPRESYLQYYFPQQALTTNPRSFGTELKNAHILPNFKHNASQRSRKQNGRTPSLQTDFHPRSVQKVTNDLRQLPQYDPYQTHFARPLNSRKMNRRLRTDPSQKAHLRRTTKPRYFHGRTYATSPTVRSLPLVFFRRGKKHRQKQERFSRPTPKPTKRSLPYIRPRREIHSATPAYKQRRRKRQEATFQVQKRGGPWCMRRCLEARLLHPAQCHALC